MDTQQFATKNEFWRLQEVLNDLSATQAQHTDRIMRLEKRNDDGPRPRSVWGPSSPFPTGLGTSQSESTLNPAAEAFRNFDVEPPSGMISSLTLDNTEDARRAAASRANSVRFDESANHYAPSRQSIDLPTRTGSGMGSHPLSERSLSHRSDGRSSTGGFGRANSFGLESSRLLGSIHNSPRVSGNPPPGFFALGPCPSIIRCWLTETFTNENLLYAAICTGSTASYIAMPLLQKVGLDNSIIEENGLRKIKLLVYLTEAKIHIASSRSSSPSPQVPTLTTKFVINERIVHDRSIQIILGSDILRAQNADILLSQDKLMIFDDDRNQLSIPLVRPEDDAAYKNLATRSRNRRPSALSDIGTMDTFSEQSTPGIIGQPSRMNNMQSTISPTLGSPINTNPINVNNSSNFPKPELPTENLAPTNPDIVPRPGDESKSTTGSEKSATTPAKAVPGVWANSWRSSSGAVSSDGLSATKGATSNYSRPAAPRPMKILRPGKSMANVSRTPSAASTPTTPFELSQQRSIEVERKLDRISTGDDKPPSAQSNPIGSGSAFGWLSSSQQWKPTTTGS